MGDKMRLVCMKTINGVDTLISATTPVGNQGSFVATIVPQGNPFWMWSTIPTGHVVGCDFTGAPLASSASTSTQRAIDNNASIGSITATPEEKLTYE